MAEESYNVTPFILLCMVFYLREILLHYVYLAILCHILFPD